MSHLVLNGEHQEALREQKRLKDALDPALQVYARRLSTCIVRTMRMHVCSP